MVSLDACYGETRYIYNYYTTMQSAGNNNSVILVGGEQYRGGNTISFVFGYNQGTKLYSTILYTACLLKNATNLYFITLLRPPHGSDHVNQVPNIVKVYFMTSLPHYSDSFK